MYMKDLLNKPLLSDAFELLKKLPDRSVDMVLTDIPYGEVNRESNGLRNLDKKKADIVDFPLQDLLKELDRVTKGSIYIFCWFAQISEIITYFKTHDFSDRVIVWEKTNPSPMNAKTLYVSGIELCGFGKRKWVWATYNGWYQNTVFRYPTAKKIPYNTQSWLQHTTPKNLALFKELILKSSNEWDIVLDPFAGSFTTAIASLETGRQFICSDREEDFITLGEARIKEYKKTKGEK